MLPSIEKTNWKVNMHGTQLVWMPSNMVSGQQLASCIIPHAFGAQLC